jgi:hypothetical protein
MGNQVSLVNKGRWGHVVLEALQVNQVHLAPKGRQGQMVFRETEAQMDHKDFLEVLDLQVLQGSQEKQAEMAHQAVKDSPVLLEHLVPEVNLGQMVHQGFLETGVLLGSKGKRVLVVNQVFQALLAQLVHQEPQELLVRKAKRVHLAHQDSKVLMALVDNQVSQVREVSLVAQAHQVQWDRQVFLGHRVNKVK